VFREQVEINARLVIEAFEEAGGDQLDEIVIALEIFAKAERGGCCRENPAPFHRDRRWSPARIFAAVVAAAFGDVDFATDDGLDVALAGFIEKLAAANRLPWSVMATAGIFWRRLRRGVRPFRTRRQED